MKAKERIDKVLDAALQRVQEEVGGLIGAELVLAPAERRIVSKASLLEDLSGKQVLAKMDIVGELEGTGGLFISVKDAIRLGGTLIMLPPSELDEVVASESYDGETEDSYGEIANIIAGSYTKTFEEMYPKACRFVRKEQEVIIPIKLDPEAEEPFPDIPYYQVGAAIVLDGKELGDLQMLIPAVPFGLATSTEEGKADADGDKEAEATAEELSREAASDAAAPETAAEPAPSRQAAAETTGSAAPAAKKVDLGKHRKRVDSLLEACRARIEEEVGALLGVEVHCSGLDNRLVSKEQFFFDEASGKQVVARLEVTGELADQSYLFIGLKDAIRIGCTLIMLPPNELEAAVTEEEFGDDSQDAYGEIANIIAGVYTAVFEEQYPDSLRFVKTDIEQVVPMKVDIDSDEPMPDQSYYLSSMGFAMGGKEYGRLQVLFPAALLKLEQLAESAPVTDDQTPDTAAAGAASEAGGDAGIAAAASGDSRTAVPAGTGESAEVLVISNADHEAGRITAILEEQGYSHLLLSFRDSVSRYLPGKFKAVFLVADPVDEQTFGMAIKVSTACRLPLVACGAEWTRSKVIKAVKYGVSDILLTPAEDDDIREKIHQNLVQLAA